MKLPVLSKTLGEFRQPSFSRFLGKRGLIAIERLMGMVLITIAVQMFMTGLQQFLAA